MLDDLRNSSSFIDDEPPDQMESVRRRTPYRRQKETFLGMTAQQRFIISLMVFLIICVMGTFALLFTGSISLPF